MKLKYIGADESEGLKHGEVYDCSIETRWGWISVLWSDPGPYGIVGTKTYRTLNEFLKNWEDASK